MAEPHQDLSNSPDTRHARKRARWNWRLAAAFLLVIIGVLSACSPNDESILEDPVAISTAGENALSTVLPTVIISVDKTTSVRAKVEQPTSTMLPTAIPSITPIPTASATNLPTEVTPSPQHTDMQTPIIPASTTMAIKPPPLPTPVDVYSWTLKVPILMYHYISIPPDDADKYRNDLSVSPTDFDEQMAYLAKNGFETVDLYDLSLAIANKRELPPKPVIITLDDGYRDNYENAFPILQKYGLDATFFVVTDFIDDNLDGYLTWDMVQEMSEAGMRIEPHSKTHADLSAREKEYIVYEVLGSMETITAHIGERPRFFCYPGGRYDDTTIEVVRELDFWGAVTTASGDWHSFNERFEWSRLRMRNTTALPEFIDLVDPGDTVSGKNVNS